MFSKYPRRLWSWPSQIPRPGCTKQLGNLPQTQHTMEKYKGSFRNGWNRTRLQEFHIQTNLWHEPVTYTHDLAIILWINMVRAQLLERWRFKIVLLNRSWIQIRLLHRHHIVVAFQNYPINPKMTIRKEVLNKVRSHQRTFTESSVAPARQTPTTRGSNAITTVFLKWR